MEIRRIRESEGVTVGDLWDRMCRETADGGPLTENGHRNLSRMLAMSAWHRDAFCLVATTGEADDERIVGFVNGRITAGDGLLPCLLGEIDSRYVIPEEQGQGVGRALAEAAIDWLHQRGARTIRVLSCVDAHDDHQFWQALGFAPDMICLTLY
jgi:GNAT superfamily N-acetyltransferase